MWVAVDAPHLKDSYHVIDSVHKDYVRCRTDVRSDFFKAFTDAFHKPPGIPHKTPEVVNREKLSSSVGMYGALRPGTTFLFI